MTLSLCMIVRNEEATLDRCLASARPYVDEIVVVDTGSTDRTVEIAGRYADVMRAIEWPGSFAVARNVSMDAATGDYILTLDADEYLRDEAAGQAVRAAADLPDLMVAYMPIHNVLSAGAMESDVVVQPRMVRNVPEVRWTAAIHNQIEHNVLAYWRDHPSLQKLVIDAPVIHTGYDLDEDARRRKYEVRVPILRRMLAETTGKEKAYYAYQLACTLHGLGEIDEANALFAAMLWDDLTTECRTYGRNLAALTAEDDAESIAHAEGMLEAAPHEPAALFMLGTALADAGETRRGLLLMCEAYLWRMAGRRCRMVLRPEFVLEVIGMVLNVNPEAIASPRAIRHIQRRLVAPVDV